MEVGISVAEDSLHMISANLFTSINFHQCLAFVGPGGKVGTMKR